MTEEPAALVADQAAPDRRAGEALVPAHRNVERLLNGAVT